MKKFLLALCLALPIFAQTYTIGDSHSQVCYLGQNISVVGSTYQDLLSGLNGNGKFAKKLRILQSPKVIILAFGTNDAVSFDPDRVAFSVDSAMVILRHRYPQAKFIIWGPPSSRAPKLKHLPEMVALLKNFAEARGIQFIDRRPLTPNMFQKDRVHLTVKGYGTLKSNILKLD